ncbi:MAG TPA: acyl carrier protein [Rhodothermales bacterium]
MKGTVEMQELIELVADILDVPIDRLSPATSREDIAEWDSLAHVRLIMEVESKFGVSVPIEAFAEIKSIAELGRYALKA